MAKRDRKELVIKETNAVLMSMTRTEQALYLGKKLSVNQKAIKDYTIREGIKAILTGQEIPAKVEDGTHVMLTVKDYVEAKYIAGIIEKAERGELDSDEMLKLQKILGEDKQVIEVTERKSLFGEPIEVKDVEEDT